jgi:hypothetical protein
MCWSFKLADFYVKLNESFKKIIIVHSRRDLGIDLQLRQICIITCFYLALISRYDNLKVDLIPYNFYNDVTSTCELLNFFYELATPT